MVADVVHIPSGENYLKGCLSGARAGGVSVFKFILLIRSNTG